MRFKTFMEYKALMNSEEVHNIKKTLKKIPKSHADLIDGWDWKFQAGNTLKGDDKHIGYMDSEKKEIGIAAPWNYGREFSVLHEIGHLVFEKFCTPKWKKEWKEIIDKTRTKQKQSDEELWCMNYANHFAKNKITIHDHDKWRDYMERFCKATEDHYGDKSQQ